jgi:DNA helicase-2/ATP-dependent DNA helicase PcrA
MKPALMAEAINNYLNNFTPDERVTLSTLHSAKGLEFDTVYIVGTNEGLIPSERNFDVEEERRLFYVGMTRARIYLYISLFETRKNLKIKPSRFLDALK